jgi:hypothetical protein
MSFNLKRDMGVEPLPISTAAKEPKSHRKCPQCSGCGVEDTTDKTCRKCQGTGLAPMVAQAEEKPAQEKQAEPLPEMFAFASVVKVMGGSQFKVAGVDETNDQPKGAIEDEDATSDLHLSRLGDGNEDEQVRRMRSLITSILYGASGQMTSEAFDIAIGAADQNTASSVFEETMSKVRVGEGADRRAMNDAEKDAIRKSHADPQSQKEYVKGLLQNTSARADFVIGNIKSFPLGVLNEIYNKIG